MIKFFCLISTSLIIFSKSRSIDSPAIPNSQLVSSSLSLKRFWALKAVNFYRFILLSKIWNENEIWRTLFYMAGVTGVIEVIRDWYKFWSNSEAKLNFSGHVFLYGRCNRGNRGNQRVYINSEAKLNFLGHVFLYSRYIYIDILTEKIIS